MIITLGTTPSIQMSMSFSAVKIDGVNRSSRTLRYASGKAINAARVLRTLGQDVCAMGFAGGDGGALLRRELNAMGAGHQFIEVTAPTRNCVTVVDRSTQSATELIEEPGTVTLANCTMLLDVLRERLEPASALLLAGSLPPGAPADFYANCLDGLPDSLITVLDATGIPLQRALPCRPTVVKPNRAELAETVGLEVATDDQLKTAIQRLIQLGPRWAVITDGPRPATVSDGNQFFRISTPTVKVLSAIGSGDSFAAGLIAGLCQGRTVPEACRLGAACGAANAMTDVSGGLSLTDVNELESRVSISVL